MILECIQCGNSRVENKELNLCASCNHARRKSGRIKASEDNNPINKRSEKTGQIERRYFARLKTWKRGKKCAATFPHECSDQITCHHMAGRGNHFYDEHAAEREIPLTLDERFWKPLCINAHSYVTEHSKWACENGYSFLRITDPVFRNNLTQ
jgi:hypothetical protein